MESFSISQFPIDTYIFLKPKARCNLFGKLKKKFGSLRIAGIYIGVPGAELYSWQRGFSNKKKGSKVKRYVSLTALKLICKELNLSVDSLQKDILEIKANSRGGLIKNPRLPLKIKPEVFAVLGHFIGDGYGGELGNACYVNKSTEALQNFVEKLTLAFGDVEYTRLDKHYRVVVSKIVPKILKKYFEIDDFRTGKCILSSKLLNSSKLCLTEFLKALIIDEGRVSDSGIDLEFSPKAHLKQDLKVVCKKLGYEFSNGKYFIISSKSFPLLRRDMGELVVPKKNEMLNRYFKRKGRSWYNRKRGITKSKILELLSSKDMSVDELASCLGIGRNSVRVQINGYNLNNKRVDGLMAQGVIKVKCRGWRNTAFFGVDR